MNRRNFIGAGIASALACLWPWRKTEGATVVRTFKVTGLDAPGELIDIPTWKAKYGSGRKGGRCRIYLDGVDITNDCFLSHTGEGWADCFVRDPRPFQAYPGQLGITRVDPVTREPVVVRRYGRLEIH